CHDIADKKQQLIKTKEQLDNTNNEIKQTVARANELKTEKQTLEQNCQEKQKTLKNVERSHNETRIQIHKQKEQIESIRGTLSTLDNQEKRLFQEIKIYEDRLESKTLELAKTQQNIEELNENQLQNERQSTNARNAVSRATEELNSITENIKETNTLIAQQEHKFQQLSDQLKNSAGKFTINQNQTLKVYEKIEKLQATITKLKEHHCETQQKLEEEQYKVIDRETIRRGLKQETKTEVQQTNKQKLHH
ncbi:unnamed protein product, partial [Rotaria sp. Silwood1]